MQSLETKVTAGEPLEGALPVTEVLDRDIKGMDVGFRV